MRFFLVLTLLLLGLIPIISKSIRSIEKRSNCDCNCNSCSTSCCTTCITHSCQSDPCTNPCNKKSSSSKKNCCCETNEESMEKTKDCPDSTTPHDVGIFTPIPPIIELPEFPIIVNNTNNNLVNLTTHINVNNVITNYNNFTFPVHIHHEYIEHTTEQNGDTSHEDDHTTRHDEETTRHHHHHEETTKYHHDHEETTTPRHHDDDNGCCFVLHPIQCYTQPDGKTRCIQRRTKECRRDICTGSVIVIEDSGESVTNSPSKNDKNCIFLRNWPYLYCGNYEKRGDDDWFRSSCINLLFFRL